MANADILRDAILSFDGPVFAVLDGAQFDDLPGALGASALRHRCLYLDRGDNHPERLVTAPQLVRLGDADAAPVSRPALDRLLSLLGERPAAVFWRCAAGGERLFRHLRGINLVLIPRERNAAAPPADDRGPDEAVLFRHADANVMVQVAPILGPAQLRRLLGPAEALFFRPDAELGGRVGAAPLKLLARQDDWPAAPPGMLRIDPDQHAAMRRDRLELSRGRLMAYLRDCAPGETGPLDDAALRRHVLAAEASGRSLGLRSEAAHGQWAFLMLTTGGEIERAPPVRSAILGSRDPDHALGRIMGEMVRHSRADAAPRAAAPGRS